MSYNFNKTFAIHSSITLSFGEGRGRGRISGINKTRYYIVPIN